MTIHAVKDKCSNYCIHVDSHDNTVGVVGLIQCRQTAGRPSPPQPYNRFNTALTPFGNGHVFALSLGGTDEARNIVPQWEQWQQTGTWRKVETACESYDGKFFRCDVEYDASAADNYVAEKAQFANDPLSSWSHPGLPIRFRVRVYAGSGWVGELAKVMADTDFTGLLAKLDKTTPTYDSGALDHSTMPTEDVQYWQNQVLAKLSESNHAMFIEDQEADATAEGMVLEESISLTDFILHPATMKQLKVQLTGRTRFSQSDINGLQADRVLCATIAFKGKGLSKAQREFAKRFPLLGGRITKRSSANKKRKLTPRELRAKNR
ncbi:MAG TPA: hypothetical protein VF264_03905 [Rhodanobacteraceae bacterium]